MEIEFFCKANFVLRNKKQAFKDKHFQDVFFLVFHYGKCKKNILYSKKTQILGPKSHYIKKKCI
jgi:hypothetical protein